MSSFKTVAIPGGTGSLGYHVSEAFLNDGSYKVKILRRKPENTDEKTNLLASKGAEIVYVDYNQKDDLLNALKGTDVIVSALSGIGTYDRQSKLLTAAKEVNVKRFIPSEFGGEYKLVNHLYIDSKAKFQEDLKKSGLEYTIIYTGLFQEYLGWVGFDVKKKEATFYVDENKIVSSTSLSDIGKYTAESLKIPEARNGTIRVAGAILSLKEYLQKFEEATGSKWKVIEDKNVRYRFQNKIDPVPSELDDFKVVALEHSSFEKIDNDKFSFTPRPVTEIINALVSQA
ncbi:aromatic alcohol reductase [Rhizophagus clarus]|uniref:Aromatic alcohol reductase n=1 Tax=Rhizophagus clarus TaxID=94130 RepID=A0A8H3L698_9GLOM|nr:aromatic alcohol reductase [Rhizophagus clarus]